VIVVALDMGKKTGWAIQDAKGRVSSGEKVFTVALGESNGMLWLRYRGWLRELLDLSGVKPLTGPSGMLAVELPHHRGGPATRVALGFLAVSQEEAESNGLAFSTVHSATLKKFVTGRGNASKTEVMDVVRARYKHFKNGGDNEADALGVLGWALAEIGERRP